MAASEKLGFTAEEFINSYKSKQDELHESVTESNLVAQLIKRLVTDAPFTGTAQVLLVHLELIADEKEKKAKFFPTSAPESQQRLRRVAPNLRNVGYVVEFRREGERDRHHSCRTSGKNIVSFVQHRQPPRKIRTFLAIWRTMADAKPLRLTQTTPLHRQPPQTATAAGEHTADAKATGLTMTDATHAVTSSANNSNNNWYLCQKNGTADEADAKIPAYSNSPTESRLDLDLYEAENAGRFKKKAVLPRS